MNDFIAYPSRWRVLGMVALGLIFAAGSLWMIGIFGAPGPSRRLPSFLVPFVGWGGLIFSVIATALWVRRLFDRRETVRIGSAGVMVRWWSDDTIPWNEITEVAPLEINGVKSISLKLRDRKQYPPRGLAALLAGADRLLTGFDLMVSLHATNRRTEDVLAAIEKFRPNS